MKYTDTLKFVESGITDGYGFQFMPEERDIKPFQHPIFDRSSQIFNQSFYKNAIDPIELRKQEINIDKNINVLRMLIRNCDDQSMIVMPFELAPLIDMISYCVGFQQATCPANKNAFIYLTVRITDGDIYYKNSQTWHVDGFQGKERHIPEQDFIWSNCNPTEYAVVPIFAENLDPKVHNFSKFLEKCVDESDTQTCKENHIYLIDPYVIHRVSNKPFNKRRIFVRLTFSPVPIKDHTNTVNPFLVQQFPFREDPRNHLIEYEGDKGMKA